MKKFFEKHETFISILLILLYILTNSYCMQNFSMFDYKTTIVNFVFALIIIIFIIKNKLGKYYSLTSFPKPDKFLYFIPLVIIVSVNLWNGININNSTQEIIFYMLTMVEVGFLEEIIFRGFLFKMLEKDSEKIAVIVTSLTFGIGHIINLFNGADLIITLLQICYCISAGYLFAIILQKGKSLWPCIITHMGINALSIFENENFISLYIIPLILIVIPILYAKYILNKFSKIE